MIRPLCQSTFVIVTLTCTVSQAQDINIANSKDVIVLVNQDRLTGEIRKGDQGTFHLDSDHAGMVSIDVEDIMSVETGVISQFLFQFKDNSILLGRLIMRERDGFSVVTKSDDTLKFRMNQLIRFFRYDALWYKRIDGYVGLGYSFTKASGLGRTNANYSLSYALKRWNFIHTLSAIYSSEVNTLERADADVAVIFNITSRWPVIDYVKYQKILELGVQGRALNICAIGNRLIVGKNLEFIVASGISFQKETATTGDEMSRNPSEVPMLFKFSLFDLNKPKIDFTATSVAFFGLSDRDRIRVDYKSNLNYEMWNDLALNLELYYNFDNRSFDYRKPYDFGVLVNVQYKF